MRLDRDIHTLFSLVALFRELRPDVVFNYMIKPVIYGSLAARMAGVPARFSMITGLGSAFGTEGGPPPPLWRAVQLMYRQSLRKNRCVFFQNPDDRRLFERLGIVHGREQIVVLNGSGVDLEHFRPAPLPQAPSFLLIARLIREKGVREYVQAARIIRARHPETAFRVAGWIDDQHAGAITERELRAWSDQGAVEFLGQLPDVRAAIAESAVYVLPSYYREGTPRTVLEAMAMGRAIVTTDAPGCRETVQEGVNGYLVPVRDGGALARALERFIKEPTLIQAMGRESRRIAIEKYDVHQVNAKILEAMELT
jgi:glycosyltransferase involved in cell wall biosynthesis